MKRFLTMLVLCFPVMSVAFAQTCPDSNHPHVIDLGIGVKFACCNMGASSPEKYGDYYSWGETAEKTTYNEYGYKYGGNKRYREYHDIGNDISGTQYDVAHTIWGGSWRMPTAAGVCWYDDLNHANYNGSYWSSTASTTRSNNTSDSYQFVFSESYIKVIYGDRAAGHSVRPVTE